MRSSKPGNLASPQPGPISGRSHYRSPSPTTITSTSTKNISREEQLIQFLSLFSNLKYFPIKKICDYITEKKAKLASRGNTPERIRSPAGSPTASPLSGAKYRRESSKSQVISLNVSNLTSKNPMIEGLQTDLVSHLQALQRHLEQVSDLSRLISHWWSHLDFLKQGYLSSVVLAQKLKHYRLCAGSVACKTLINWFILLGNNRINLKQKYILVDKFKQDRVVYHEFKRSIESFLRRKRKISHELRMQQLNLEREQRRRRNRELAETCGIYQPLADCSSKVLMGLGKSPKIDEKPNSQKQPKNPKNRQKTVYEIPRMEEEGLRIPTESEVGLTSERDHQKSSLSRSLSGASSRAKKRKSRPKKRRRGHLRRSGSKRRRSSRRGHSEYLKIQDESMDTVYLASQVTNPSQTQDSGRKRVRSRKRGLGRRSSSRKRGLTASSHQKMSAEEVKASVSSRRSRSRFGRRRRRTPKNRRPSRRRRANFGLLKDSSTLLSNPGAIPTKTTGVDFEVLEQGSGGLSHRNEALESRDVPQMGRSGQIFVENRKTENSQKIGVESNLGISSDAQRPHRHHDTIDHHYIVDGPSEEPEDDINETQTTKAYEHKINAWVSRKHTQNTQFESFRPSDVMTRVTNQSNHQKMLGSAETIASKNTPYRREKVVIRADPGTDRSLTRRSQARGGPRTAGNTPDYHKSGVELSSRNRRVDTSRERNSAYEQHRGPKEDLRGMRSSSRKPKKRGSVRSQKTEILYQARDYAHNGPSGRYPHYNRRKYNQTGPQESPNHEKTDFEEYLKNEPESFEMTPDQSSETTTPVIKEDQLPMKTSEPSRITSKASMDTNARLKQLFDRRRKKEKIRLRSLHNTPKTTPTVDESKENTDNNVTTDPEKDFSEKTERTEKTEKSDFSAKKHTRGHRGVLKGLNHAYMDQDSSALATITDDYNSKSMEFNFSLTTPGANPRVSKATIEAGVLVEHIPTPQNALNEVSTDSDARKSINSIYLKKGAGSVEETESYTAMDSVRKMDSSKLARKRPGSKFRETSLEVEVGNEESRDGLEQIGEVFGAVSGGFGVDKWSGSHINSEKIKEKFMNQMASNDTFQRRRSSGRNTTPASELNSCYQQSSDFIKSLKARIIPDSQAGAGEGTDRSLVTQTAQMEPEEAINRLKSRKNVENGQTQHNSKTTERGDKVASKCPETRKKEHLVDYNIHTSVLDIQMTSPHDKRRKRLSTKKKRKKRNSGQPGHNQSSARNSQRAASNNNTNSKRESYSSKKNSIVRHIVFKEDLEGDFGRSGTTDEEEEQELRRLEKEYTTEDCMNIRELNCSEFEKQVRNEMKSREDGVSSVTRTFSGPTDADMSRSDQISGLNGQKSPYIEIDYIADLEATPPASVLTTQHGGGEGGPESQEQMDIGESVQEINFESMKSGTTNSVLNAEIKEIQKQSEAVSFGSRASRSGRPPSRASSRSGKGRGGNDLNFCNSKNSNILVFKKSEKSSLVVTCDNGDQIRQEEGLEVAGEPRFSQIDQNNRPPKIHQKPRLEALAELQSVLNSTDGYKLSSFDHTSQQQSPETSKNYNPKKSPKSQNPPNLTDSGYNADTAQQYDTNKTLKSSLRDPAGHAASRKPSQITHSNFDTNQTNKTTRTYGATTEYNTGTTQQQNCSGIAQSQSNLTEASSDQKSNREELITLLINIAMKKQSIDFIPLSKTYCYFSKLDFRRKGKFGFSDLKKFFSKNNVFLREDDYFFLMSIFGAHERTQKVSFEDFVNTLAGMTKKGSFLPKNQNLAGEMSPEGRFEGGATTPINTSVNLGRTAQNTPNLTEVDSDGTGAEDGRRRGSEGGNGLCKVDRNAIPIAGVNTESVLLNNGDPGIHPKQDFLKEARVFSTPEDKPRHAEKPLYGLENPKIDEKFEKSNFDKNFKKKKNSVIGSNTSDQKDQNGPHIEGEQVGEQSTSKTVDLFKISRKMLNSTQNPQNSSTRYSRDFQQRSTALHTHQNAPNAPKEYEDQMLMTPIQSNRMKKLLARGGKSRPETSRRGSSTQDESAVTNPNGQNHKKRSGGNSGNGSVLDTQKTKQTVVNEWRYAVKRDFEPDDAELDEIFQQQRFVNFESFQDKEPKIQRSVNQVLQERKGGAYNRQNQQNLPQNDQNREKLQDGFESKIRAKETIHASQGQHSDTANPQMDSENKNFDQKIEKMEKNSNSQKVEKSDQNQQKTVSKYEKYKKYDNCFSKENNIFRENPRDVNASEALPHPLSNTTLIYDARRQHQPAPEEFSLTVNKKCRSLNTSTTKPLTSRQKLQQHAQAYPQEPENNQGSEYYLREPIKGVYYPNVSTKFVGSFMIKKLRRRGSGTLRKPGKLLNSLGCEIDLSKYTFVRQGKGMLKLKIGDAIKGFWRNDRLEGDATLILHDKTKSLKKSMIHCKDNDIQVRNVKFRHGQLISPPTKSKSVIIFEKRLKNGQNLIITSNKEVYVGECIESLKHGHGCSYYPMSSFVIDGSLEGAENRKKTPKNYFSEMDSFIAELDSKEDLAEFLDQQTKKKRLKKRYEGEHRFGEEHGRGLQYNPLGFVEYRGEFINGSRHGWGSLFSLIREGENVRNVKVYEGEFFEGSHLDKPPETSKGQEGLGGSSGFAWSNDENNFLPSSIFDLETDSHGGVPKSGGSKRCSQEFLEKVGGSAGKGKGLYAFLKNNLIFEKSDSQVGGRDKESVIEHYVKDLNKRGITEKQLKEFLKNVGFGKRSEISLSVIDWSLSQATIMNTPVKMDSRR